MKAIGSNSVSSFLLASLNAFSLLIAFVLVVASGFLVFSAMAGKPMISAQLGADGAPNVDTGPNVHMKIPVALTLDPRTVQVTAPGLGIEEAELEDAQASLRFAPRGGMFFAANLALVVGALAVMLWLLAQLRGLFRALRDGQPFARSNARRVRRIAWTLMASEVVRAGIVYAENSYVASHFVATGLHFEVQPHLNLFAVFNGLVILVLSEVFRAGTRLDEDQSLTV